jgi:pyridinium-3,5-biscarboxylic acid mononucleotide synthase
MSEIKLDFPRQERLGFDEAIFCAGKTTGQIRAILDQAASNGGRFLLTRLGEDQFAALPEAQRGSIDYEPLSRTAYYGTPLAAGGRVQIAIVAAGTSDLPVSREAARTLNYYGERTAEFNDVGVAGLWRLAERIEEIRASRVVIVVAGMDAALVSVIGGLVAGSVIAVPTSVGYGVAAGGQAALYSALASCAPGVVAVNIDNGYGAACAALRVVRTAR